MPWVPNGSASILDASCTTQTLLSNPLGQFGEVHFSASDPSGPPSYVHGRAKVFTALPRAEVVEPRQMLHRPSSDGQAEGIAMLPAVFITS